MDKRMFYLPLGNSFSLKGEEIWTGKGNASKAMRIMLDF